MSVPEHDAGLVAALHPLNREDPLDDGCLPNVADVDSRPEARHDLRGVEQHAHTRLQLLVCSEILARHWPWLTWKYWHAIGWLLWGLMATMPRLSWDSGMSSARAALCCARTSRHAALLRRMLDT